MAAMHGKVAHGNANNSEQPDTYHQTGSTKPLIFQHVKQFQHISIYGGRAWVSETLGNTHNSDNLTHAIGSWTQNTGYHTSSSNFNKSQYMAAVLR